MQQIGTVWVDKRGLGKGGLPAIFNTDEVNMCFFSCNNSTTSKALLISAKNKRLQMVCPGPVCILKQQRHEMCSHQSSEANTTRSLYGCMKANTQKPRCKTQPQATDLITGDH